MLYAFLTKLDEVEEKVEIMQLNASDYVEDEEISDNGINDLQGVQETEVDDTSASTSTPDESFQRLKAPATFVDNKRKYFRKT